MAKKGFLTYCPMCGTKGNVWIDASDVTALKCMECESTITASELRARVDGWTCLLDWLDTAPDREGREG